MRDRNRSGFVLRLVTAPHRSDPGERQCAGTQVDDPDVDAQAHATDAGPLFW